MSHRKVDSVEVDGNGKIVQIVWSCGCAWDSENGNSICSAHKRDPYSDEGGVEVTA